MRFLRPSHLITLESGLWAVDEFQPVAVVLDPETGEVRRVVSWPELSPAPARGSWPPALIADGTSLWVQEHADGSLVRIGPSGIETAAWTDGLRLAACGPGVAWCTSEPPRQELVQGADAKADPHVLSTMDRLLRVTADGHQDLVFTDRRVRGAYPSADGLVVQIDDAPWRLHHLGADTYEVDRTGRWITLPWDATPPTRLTVAEHATRDRPPRIVDKPGNLSFSWYDDEDDPRASVRAAGRRWRLGRSSTRSDSRPPWRTVLVSARDGDVVVRRFDLGAGDVATARAIAGDSALGVAIRRPGDRIEVLSLRPDRDEVTVLLAGDAVDITEHCWPLVPRPLDTDSYESRVLAGNDSLDDYWTGEDGVRPLAKGLSGATARLIGEWPSTRLEWTFSWTGRPGLILRRRIPLYDELGRPAAPEYDDIHLMEDLVTGAIPLASAAVDGLLDL